MAGRWLCIEFYLLWDTRWWLGASLLLVIILVKGDLVHNDANLMFNSPWHPACYPEIAAHLLNRNFLGLGGFTSGPGIRLFFLSDWSTWLAGNVLCRFSSLL